ncbi:MAG: MAE_28990/MAE_18760 family HEPN-like nuclease [Desulfovibrionaceae bacterium]
MHCCSSKLDEFVKRRNNIAHGKKEQSKITIKKYNQYEFMAYNEIMYPLKDLVFTALTQKYYLNKNTLSLD